MARSDGGSLDHAHAVQGEGEVGGVAVHDPQHALGDARPSDDRCRWRRPSGAGRRAVVRRLPEFAEHVEAGLGAAGQNLTVREAVALIPNAGDLPAEIESGFARLHND
ncbi:hypothetical protein ACIBO5_41730 [Nonomuraea angiospora]|uniref:hypothetical protein n=1 Tax=Nonomuraea angiospora TaxID=46172 RepID=UPI0037900972